MLKLLLIICLIPLNAFAQKNPENETKTEAEAEEVNAQYLKVSRLKLPADLSRIDEEVRKNLLDTIITSKKFILLISDTLQKSNQNYSSINLLEVEITPAANDLDLFIGKFKMTNIVNKKSARLVTVNIYRFNFLTDFRMGVYELIFGKHYVKTNRDKLLQFNQDRIQKINQQLNQQNDTPKKPEIKAILELEKIKRIARKENRRNKTKGQYQANVNTAYSGRPYPAPEKASPENPKSDQGEGNKTATNKNLSSKNEQLEGEEENKEKDSSQTNQEPSLFSPPSPFESSISYQNFFKIHSDYFVMTSSFNGLLKVNSSLQFVSFGAQIEALQIVERPWQWIIDLSSAIPNKKKGFEIPLYRSFGVKLVRHKIFSDFAIYANLAYEPLYVVNVPEAGAGLTLYEIDITWASLGFTGQFNMANLLWHWDLGGGLSPLVTSNIDNLSMKGVRLNLGANVDIIKDKMNFYFKYQSLALTGQEGSRAADITSSIFKWGVIYRL